MVNASKKKPYPVIEYGGVLTDDSLLMGIPVKDWDAAFTGNFEKNLERGNKIIARLKKATRSTHSHQKPQNDLPEG